MPKAFQIILLYLVMTSCKPRAMSSLQAAGDQPLTADEIALREQASASQRKIEAQFGPNDCRAQYYAVFAENPRVFLFDYPVKIARPDAVNETERSSLPYQSIASTFRDIKDLYLKEFLPPLRKMDLLKDHLRAIDEFGERIALTHLVVMDSEYQERFEATHKVSFDEYLSLASVFMDTSNQFSFEKSTPPKRGEFINKNYVGEDILVQRTGSRILLGEIFAQAVGAQPVMAFFFGHEFSHLIDSGSYEQESCLEREIGALRQRKSVFDDLNKSNRKYLFEIIPELKSGTLPKKELSYPFYENSIGGGEAGFGRDSFDVRTLQGLHPAELSDLERRLQNHQVDQLREAAADVRGIALAVAYIKSHYQDLAKRQQAARAILAAFPPNFLEGKRQELADKVGSKKTNEARVERIFFANPEYRKLLNCTIPKEQTVPQCHFW